MNNDKPIIPFPDKKYDIIYADPPWKQNDKLRSAKDQSIVHVSNYYSSMTFKQLSDMQIDSIANKNSLLFLWVVSASIKECIEVGESWGFAYRTIAFIWYKKNTNMGNYTMPNCELCAVFKRGNIPKPRGSRGIQQFVSAQRGRHSQKPTEVRCRINQMFPSQSKIELFARPDWTDYTSNWEFWGDEV